MDLLTQLLGQFMPSCGNSMLGMGAKSLAMMVALQASLRLAAEVLTRLAVKTNNASENQMAQMAGQAAWYLGTILGLFGVGTPTAVMQKAMDTSKSNSSSTQPPAQG